MSRTAHKLMASSGGGEAYEIDQSVLIDKADNGFMYRRATSEGNRKTWTYSCWFKRATVGITSGTTSYQYLFACSIYGGNETSIRLAQDSLQVYSTDSGVSDWGYYSNAKYRDVSAWYHIVVACDTTDSTEADRVKIYMNGERITDWSSPNHASLNFDTMINNTNWHSIGVYKGSGGANTNNGIYGWDGYVAEAYLLDGTALPASSFGETDSTTGQWIPKKTAFTSSQYGTNGWYLKFASGAIGTDSSGEGNNFTTTNLANTDIMLDSPTNNFCTLNATQTYNSDTGSLLEGLLHLNADTYNGGHYSNISSTFNVPPSGKWYAECRVGISSGGGNVAFFGVTNQEINWDGVANENLVGADGLFSSLYGDYIKVCDSGTVGTGNTSATAGAYILAMALDVDNGYAYFGVDSGSAMVWYKADGSTSGGDPTSGSTGTGGFARTFDSDDVITVSTAIPAPGYTSNGSMNTLNFGQNGSFGNRETAKGNTDGNGYGNFWRAPPSGYLALCTKNLPTPAIKKSTEHFNTILWTGNNTEDRALTGVGFAPDLVWLKSRSTTYWHQLHDRVRGTSGGGLYSNRTDAETGSSYGFASFDSDGFTVMKDANNDAQNDNGETYVAWNWKGGDTPNQTYTVKVVSDSGNKYRFNDFASSALTLNLSEGGTYTFDQSDSSNAGHPLRFSTTANGSHGGGSEYTTGVTTSGTPGSSGAYTRITVASGAATLYYYCTAHSGMGGQANTNSTAGSTNLDGAIASVVSANVTAGFSIVSFTGDSSAANTVGHGLGKEPKAIFYKRRDGTSHWYMVTKEIDGSQDYMSLSSTAVAAASEVYGNPTTSTISNWTWQANPIIAYCFAEIVGYSKFGMYIGNGYTNGAFINTGFQPAYILIKNTSVVDNWHICDVTRSIGNPYNDVLRANINNAESANHAGFDVDSCATGFKIKSTNSELNTNNNNYWYMAFAEFPAKYANAR